MTAQETSREIPEDAPPETKGVLNLFYAGGAQVTILSELTVQELNVMINECIAQGKIVSLKSLPAKGTGPEEYFFFDPRGRHILFFNAVDASKIKDKPDIKIVPANAIPHDGKRVQ